MKSKLEKLKSNRFARNFMKLFSATLLAQVITIALSPVLTRLYSPEDFGLYSVYMAIVSLIIVYATGRYEFAIAVAKTKEESEHLLRLVILMSLGSSMILVPIIAIFGEYFNEILGLEQSSSLLIYIPFTIVFLGIMQGLNYYYNRQKDFSSISSAKIVQSIGTGGFSVGFASFNFHSVGMILANILGILVANLYNIVKTKVWKIFYFSKRDLIPIKKVAIKYKNYPLWNSTSAFFDVLAIQAPVLVLGYFFSSIMVGFYSLTVRVVGLPIIIISNAVAQVYLSEIAEKENKGESIEKIVKKAAQVLGGVGLIPTVILIGWGSSIFILVFGAEWAFSGELVGILAISYYMKFIIAPLSVVFLVKEKIKLLSIIQLVRAITTVITLILSSIVFKDFSSVIWSYVIHEILVYLITGYYIRKIIK